MSEKSKVAIVVAEFRKDHTMRMLNTCIETLMDDGLREDQIEVIWVPGSFEIPYQVKKLALTKTFDCIITLGMVMKGDTYHFEMIANEVARGLMNIMLEEMVPVIFGVQAVFNEEQAAARSGDTELNRGLECAHAALHVLKNGK